MPIRSATPRDQDAIRTVHQLAFPEGESGTVAKLATELLLERLTPPTQSLVAEIAGTVVGHVAFSPVSIADDDGFQGYLLAPLGVKPEHQRRRLGTTLVETGIEELRNLGAQMVFVYGDPNYYGRFGFNAKLAAPYCPPYPLQYPFGWQGLTLKPAQGDRVPSPVNITCVPALCRPELW